MAIITLNTNGQTQLFRGGDYQIIARLGTGAATLKVRFQGSAAAFEDFTDGVLTSDSDVLTLADCELELTKTGTATVEFVRISHP
tara:strand:- start:496 stop:750 length:255 start_codon:yes stop_codon:yes gene_type:complete